MKAILILISHFPISNLGTIHTIRISWMFGIHFIEWQKINTTAMIKPNLAIAISFPRRFEWTWVVTEPFRFRIFSEKSKPLYNWSMIIGSSYNLNNDFIWSQRPKTLPGVGAGRVWSWPIPFSSFMIKMLRIITSANGRIPLTRKFK